MIDDVQQHVQNCREYSCPPKSPDSSPRLFITKDNGWSNSSESTFPRSDGIWKSGGNYPRPCQQAQFLNPWGDGSH